MKVYLSNSRHKYFPNQSRLVPNPLKEQSVAQTNRPTRQALQLHFSPEPEPTKFSKYLSQHAPSPTADSLFEKIIPKSLILTPSIKVLIRESVPPSVVLQPTLPILTLCGETGVLLPEFVQPLSSSNSALISRFLLPDRFSADATAYASVMAPCHGLI